MMKKNNVWVRVAPHGARVKEDHAHKWRCCFSDKRGGSPAEEIPLTHCSVSGDATPENMIFDTNPRGGTCLEGVVAWIDFYGNATIEKGALHVELRDPMPNSK